MATAPDPELPKRSYGPVLLARLLALSLAAAALWWAADALTVASRVTPLNRLADRILNDEPVSLEILVRVLPQVDAVRQLPRCAAGNRFAAVAIESRVLEQATAAGDAGLAARMLSALHDDTRDFVSCSPHDAYAWFAVYQLRTYERGFRPADLKLLRKSIELAPREGWLMLKRLPVMLDIAEALPPDLQQRILEDFAGLASDGHYFEQLADLVTELTPARRQALFAGLSDIPERRRLELRGVLRRRGIPAEIPGLPAIEPRPWR